MGTLPLNVSLAPAPEAAAEAARDAGCDQLSTKLQSTDDRIPYRDPYEDFIGESHGTSEIQWVLLESESPKDRPAPSL
mgnify:CR=1 FL=1|jgi:hypothetical protein